MKTITQNELKTGSKGTQSDRQGLWTLFTHLQTLTFVHDWVKIASVNTILMLKTKIH